MKKINILLLFCLTLGNAKAQEVYFKAMEDEMKRTLDSLTLPGLPSPFFVAYTIVDSREYLIQGQNGAIFKSEETPVMFPLVRVVIGDTMVTNEYSGQFADNSRRSLPLDKDYDEIRRILWKQTDQAYRGSTRSYMSKQNYLQQLNMTGDEPVVANMFHLPAVNNISPLLPLEGKARIERWEKYVRMLMQELERYGSLENYTVRLSGICGNTFRLSGNGSRIQAPVSDFSLEIAVEVLNAGNGKLGDHIVWCGNSMEDFPDEKSVRRQLKDLTLGLFATARAIEMKESYFGPVLLEEDAVTDFIQASLLPRLMARKSETGERNIRLPEDKIGKRIAASGISVQSLPFLNVCNGQPLWGSFRLDGDGIAPRDSLLLLSGGILKDLLNGNVPTNYVRQPNGYNRAVISNGMIPVVAPGVLKIWGVQPLNRSDMKHRLLEAAKKEGVDYAYRITGLTDQNGEFRTSRIFRVYPDGREEKVQSGTVRLSPASLRRIVAASSDEYGYNRLWANVPVSYVTPGAILIEEVEIEPYESGSFARKMVTAPRKRIGK